MSAHASRRRTAFAAAMCAALATAVATPEPGRAEDPPDEGWYCVAFPYDRHWATCVAGGPDASVHLLYTTSSAEAEPRRGEAPPDGTPEFVGLTVLDRRGHPRWTAYLWGSWPRPADVCVAADGGIWALGTGALVGLDGRLSADRETRKDDDLWVARFDPDGTQTVAFTFGGSLHEHAAHLAPCGDADVVVTGVTESSDFPVVAAFQPELAGSRDIVVARVRGDGSGLVWASYLGGPDLDEPGGLTRTGTEGVVVARVSSPVPSPDYWSRYGSAGADAGTAAFELELVGVAPDGTREWSRLLPNGDSGSVVGLGAQPDGGVLAGGVARFRLGESRQNAFTAFVSRTDPSGERPDALWTEHDLFWLERISTTPTGEAVLGTDLWFQRPYSIGQAIGFDYGIPNHSRARALSADLAEEWTVLDPGPYGAALDVEATPDGAVCALGIGLTTTFPVQDPALTTWSTWVARVPLRAGRAASDLRADAATRHSVRLRWNADGDPVTAYEIERLALPGWRSNGPGAARWAEPHWTVVGTAAAGDTRAVIRGLPAGGAHELRVVSRFPSGIRAPSPSVRIDTHPVRPTALRASYDERRGGVQLSLEDRENAPGNTYELESRTGFGPWTPLRAESRTLGYSRHAFHLPDRTRALGIRYRVRAVTVEEGLRSRWTYSRGVFLPPGAGRER